MAHAELEGEAEEGELDGAVWRTCEDMELEEGNTELEEGKLAGTVEEGGMELEVEAEGGELEEGELNRRRRASWRGQRSWRPLSLPPFS